MATSVTLVRTKSYSTAQSGHTTMPSGFTQAVVTLVVTSNFVAPQSVSLDIEWSGDGGATWNPIVDRSFAAPLVNRQGQTILQDGMAFNDLPPAGSLIQGTATPLVNGVPGAVTFGITATLS